MRDPVPLHPHCLLVSSLFLLFSILIDVYKYHGVNLHDPTGYDIEYFHVHVCQPYILFYGMFLGI